MDRHRNPRARVASNPTGGARRKLKTLAVSFGASSLLDLSNLQIWRPRDLCMERDKRNIATEAMKTLLELL